MARQQTFEGSLERLTEIVSKLERDDTPLADAMKLYEEGISLAQTCRKELETAELKIMELRQGSASGDLSTSGGTSNSDEDAF